MRYHHKPWPKEGDRRKRRKFLLWPLRIDLETRWLEVAEWEEKYIEEPCFGDYGGGYSLWSTLGWLN